MADVRQLKKRLREEQQQHDNTIAFARAVQDRESELKKERDNLLNVLKNLCAAEDAGLPADDELRRLLFQVARRLISEKNK